MASPRARRVMGDGTRAMAAGRSGAGFLSLKRKSSHKFSFRSAVLFATFAFFIAVSAYNTRPQKVRASVKPIIKGVVMGVNAWVKESLRPNRISDDQLHKAETLGATVVYKSVPGFLGVGHRQIGPYFIPPEDPMKYDETKIKSVQKILNEKLQTEEYYGGRFPKAVFALDFDGVLADSAPESSETAWRSAMNIWPDIFDFQVTSSKKEILAKMIELRPVIETGWENPVLIRCIIEGMDGIELLENWNEIREEKMEEWDLDKDQLKIIFGKERDNWIAHDLRDWITTNEAYNAMRFFTRDAVARHEVYIVTTKQKRFVELLLKKKLFLNIPSSRIFDTSSGKPKAEVLKSIQNKHPDASRFVFIEDKLSTLEKVKGNEDLNKWQLYLAEWGYNTADERMGIIMDERIQLLDYQKAFYLMGELPEDKVIPKPCFQQGMQPSDLHEDSQERLLAAVLAQERFDLGIATAEDMYILSTTPRKYKRARDVPKWRKLLMVDDDFMHEHN